MSFCYQDYVENVVSLMVRFFIFYTVGIVLCHAILKKSDENLRGRLENNSTCRKFFLSFGRAYAYQRTSFYFVVTAPGWGADDVQVKDTPCHESCDVWLTSTR